MEVIVGRHLGFCAGVRRAVGIATEAAERHGHLRSDGSLVHNRQATEYLAGLGVGPDAPDDAPFLIRAHGIAPAEREALLAAGTVLVDATCPHIARSQRLAREAADAGAFLVLAGDRDHAEVKAVAGAADGRCLVVTDLDDLAAVPADAAVVLVAQTTFSVALFEKMGAALRERFPGCRIVDTICRATHDRQDEVDRLSENADAVAVVGGRNSANTRRLAEISARHGRPVFVVETEAELAPENFAGVDKVAVVSGASTPDWVIDSVLARLREF
ncbi:MAG: 4-hydroxy-3-methylbut-2-enyl diphosphate reductase [Planctomycetes bacterium]|nr:4-hydroxy-3-methylbut-2-enyl diphosphate reductase [Planctomycetota bacterium]